MRTELASIPEEGVPGRDFPPMRLDTLQTIFDLEDSVYYWMIQRFSNPLAAEYTIVHAWLERLYEGTFAVTPVLPRDTWVLAHLQEAFESYRRFEAP
jgi:hypothetical protein